MKPKMPVRVDDDKMNEIDQLGFFVEAYPNPSSDNGFALHLIAAPDEAVNVTIFDVTGRVVEYNANVNEQTILGKELPAGVYHATVIQGDNKQVLQIVKTN